MKNLTVTQLNNLRLILVDTLAQLSGPQVLKLKDIKDGMNTGFAQMVDALEKTDKPEAGNDVVRVNNALLSCGQRVTLERALRFNIRTLDTQIDTLNAAADKLQSAIDAPAAEPSMITLNGNRAPRQTIDDVIGELDALEKSGDPAWNSCPAVTTQKLLDDGAAVHAQAEQFWSAVNRLNVPVAVAREIAFEHRDHHHCAMHDLVIASAQNIVKKLYMGIASAKCDYLFLRAKAKAPNKVELFEKAIIKTLLEDILAAGCAVIVCGPNGPEHNDPRTDFDKIWPELFAQDFEHLTVYGPIIANVNSAPMRRRYGFVSLVHGNGEDVISDYTVETEIERLQVRASQVAEMIREVEYADA